MLSCLMVADDFTGACDTGWPFARAGLTTQVVLEVAPPWPEVDVLALTTESRNCTRSEAEQRVRLACEKCKGVPATVIFKKIDSALRGHLATEIRTVMSVLGFDLCLVAPAYPQMGRVTVGGYHLVHGVPVGRTEVGHDPGCPVGGSHLLQLMAVEDKLGLQSIDLEDVTRGQEHVLALVEALRGKGPTAIVLDAASAGDLACIASVAARLTPAPLLCGSAGLATQVPAAFGLKRRATKPLPLATEGPVLAVVGTGESITRQQVAHLKRRRGMREWEVHVDATVHAWQRPHLPRAIEEMADYLARGEDVVLSLVGLREGHTREEVAEAMLTLGQAVQRLARCRQPAGLIASGGWTAVEVLRALGGTGARIVSEASPGVPVSRIQGGPFHELPLITKGGALGAEDVLVNAMDALKGGVPFSPDRPLLALTLGDACGVGPEVVLKALAREEVYRLCRPLVIGHPDILKRDLGIAGVSLEIRTVGCPEEGRYQWGAVDVFSPVDLDVSQIQVGVVCPEAGRAAAEWVIAGVELAISGRLDGIVTAPLNKEAMNLAGFAYAGHTELLAARSGAKRAFLMLASERLTVSHVTGHVALSEVPQRLTTDLIFETISLTREALIGFDKSNPKIAVCGLNPHAGENGLFGREDAEIIRPAVERGREKGWPVEGPLPADTTFFKVYDGLYDGVVAMYHDQGHVPAKLVAFDQAVNVTLGLPIVRTSVDHGTAFDIAGKGLAKAGNMLHALRLGAKLAAKRKGDRAISMAGATP